MGSGSRMNDTFHRVITGAITTRKELIIAAYVVIFWILIDVIQFVGWIMDKWPAPNDIPL
jgi:hypothetical protein